MILVCDCNRIKQSVMEKTLHALGYRTKERTPGAGGAAGDSKSSGVCSHSHSSLPVAFVQRFLVCEHV